MLKRLSGIILTAAVLAFAPHGLTDGPLLGFTPDGAARQRALEAQFDAAVDRANLERWMKRLTSAPNHVGAPHTRENASWIAAQFRVWGYDVTVDTFHVLFPTPTERVVELVAPTEFRAALREPTISEDETSGVLAGRLPPYNAYSADGDVTAELVYVNYGIPDDYEELERRGVSVDGKIVIARYGASWRGIKPKVAAEHGAVACILYSDPVNDGYRQGDVYPDGAWRMAEGVQRGSVVDMPTYPGDPLTPFRGATRDAERLTRAASATLMKIPVLPISYADAQPLLEALGGPVAPTGWRGGLPITYHIGPGPATVRVKLAFAWRLEPVYDVIATLTGNAAPDQWVVRGNHHDAWVFGAADPMSGMVALMEEARVVGALAKAGWRPKRTVVYAAWDAEEPGLLGSTEWVEHHARELDEKAVVYLNTDSNSRGFLNVGGSHTLERFVNQVAADVTDPQTDVSVWQRLQARERVAGNDEVDAAGDLPVYALGSGSDYTAFLQHLAVPSLMVNYGGEGGGGSYHSIFDSFDHYVRFGDPGFAYGVALIQTMGRMTLRLANAEVLPLRFGNLAETIDGYVDEVVQLTDEMRQRTERSNALIRDGAYRLAADPKEPYEPPSLEEPVPHVNVAPLQNAVARLMEAAARYDALLEQRMATGGLSETDADRLNQILARAERALRDEAGLPRRPWFRHTIYAPGFYTGYGVKTLPGLREGIEQRHWQEAEAQMLRVAAAVERMAVVVEQGAEVLETRD
jgi:N-acetylated-alpha-linked acidic dipeptidase